MYYDDHVRKQMLSEINQEIDANIENRFLPAETMKEVASSLKIRLIDNETKGKKKCVGLRIAVGIPIYLSPMQRL